MRTLKLPKTERMRLSEYKKKVYEEMMEFIDELESERDLEALASEFMDVVQSGLNYLEALQIDINEVNKKHVEKLESRGIVVDDKSY